MSETINRIQNCNNLTAGEGMYVIMMLCCVVPFILSDLLLFTTYFFLSYTCRMYADTWTSSNFYTQWDGLNSKRVKSKIHFRQFHPTVCLTKQQIGQHKKANITHTHSQHYMRSQCILNYYDDDCDYYNWLLCEWISVSARDSMLYCAESYEMTKTHVTTHTEYKKE